MTHDQVPSLVGNPLLDQHRRSTAQGSGEADRARLVHLYGFAIPTEEALASVAAASPGGVVELGAGTGYWARLLHERGVDIVAYDLFPPPSPASRWFAGVTPWYPVVKGGEAMLQHHGHRTLMLVWPSRNEEWAARATSMYHRAGGQALVFVGEGPGGRTGDDQFHAMLGHYDRCLACAFDLTDVACICGVSQGWQLRSSIELPHWPERGDDLHVYSRVDAAEKGAPPPGRSRRRATAKRSARRRGGLVI